MTEPEAGVHDRHERDQQRPATTTSEVSPELTPSSMIILSSSGRRHDQRGVDDRHGEEARDQPPVRPREAQDPAHACGARSCCRRRSGHCAGAATAVLPLPVPSTCVHSLSPSDAGRTPASAPVFLRGTTISRRGRPRRRGSGVPAPPARGGAARRGRAPPRPAAGPWSRGRRRASVPRGPRRGRRPRRRGRPTAPREVARPIRTASSAADDPGGGADLERPGVADVLDQRLGAGEVGHQAERRLLHGELRVVGHHPQVAGQRELEAGADGVAADRGDRDEARVAQPGEAALVLVDPRGRLLVAEREQADDALLARRRRVEHRPVEAGGERVALPRHHHDAYVVGQGAPDLAEREPHRRRLGVAHVGTVEGDGRDRAVDVEAESDGGEVCGSHAAEVTTDG